MYKIFINEIPVFIHEDKPAANFESTDLKPAYFFTQRKEIKKAMQQIEAGGLVRSLTVYGDDAKAIRSHLFSDYKIIKAAGGIVMNTAKDVLMIYRHGMWDLPKGKLELNEKIPEAAIREVMEETGLEDVEIIKKLMKTYHTYLINGNKVLKITHWFLMRSNETDFIPQIAEGIEHVKWVTTSELEKKYKQTYKNIQSVLDAGIISAYLV
ncbi:MAG: NUDIX domain-containing protein [Chitinophagales bacterium]|nr:NUDIX domain-containing protein [Chitinophagales bacterium]